MVRFINQESNGKKTLWGTFSLNNGYMQGVDFAKYLLKTNEPETFKAVMSTSIGLKEYTLKDYINEFSA